MISLRYSTTFTANRIHGVCVINQHGHLQPGVPVLSQILWRLSEFLSTLLPKSFPSIRWQRGRPPRFVAPGPFPPALHCMCMACWPCYSSLFSREAARYPFSSKLTEQHHIAVSEAVISFVFIHVHPHTDLSMPPAELNCSHMFKELSKVITKQIPRWPTCLLPHRYTRLGYITPF
jgi:hypothetical protein